MKAIIMALGITAIAVTGAEAQSKRTIVEKEVCTTSGDLKTETCHKNVYHYTNDVYQGKEPTQVLIKKTNSENRDVQYCEKAPGSNIVVCHNTKPNSESPTFYKMCRDDQGYSMYCTPHIPTNTVWPFTTL